MQWGGHLYLEVWSHKRMRKHASEVNVRGHSLSEVKLKKKEIPLLKSRKERDWFKSGVSKNSRQTD